MTRERWTELLEAAPLISQRDVELLKGFIPRVRPMVHAVAMALGGTIRFYRKA